MNRQTETSGRDETLATGLYTSPSVTGQLSPQIRLTSFEYSIRRTKLLDGAGATFGASLTRELPAEHRAMLERNEPQSSEDMALARRMHDVQRKALAR